MESVVLPEDRPRFAGQLAALLYNQGMDQFFGPSNMFPNRSQIEKMAVETYDRMAIEQAGAVPVSMSSNRDPKAMSNTEYATSTTPLFALMEKGSVHKVGEPGLVPAFQQEGGFHNVD